MLSKSFRKPTLVLWLALASACSGGGGDDSVVSGFTPVAEGLELEISSPKWKAFLDPSEGKSVSVSARIVGSATELQADLVARIAGREIELSPTLSNRWRATLDTEALPTGKQTLAVYATTEDGVELSQGVLVRVDAPPTLTVRSPLPGTVADPMMEIDVACSDDQPNCRIEVRRGNKLFAKGKGSVKAMVDLSAFYDSKMSVTIDAIDSAGQEVRQPMPIHIERILPPLTEVAVAEDLVLDFDGSRLLTRRHTGGPSDLTILGADGKVESKVPVTGPQFYAALTPAGAVARSSSGVDIWNSSAGEMQTHTSNYLAHDGNFMAIFMDPERVLRVGALPATEEEFGPLEGFFNYVQMDVDDQGTIALSRTEVVLIEGDEVKNLGAGRDPKVGGGYVLFSRGADLVLWDGDSAAQILSGAFQPYDVADGWAVFSRYNLSDERAIWRVDPTGLESQVTEFVTESELETLGDGGRFTFFNYSPGLGSRRYLADEFGNVIDIGSGAGKVVARDGELYRILGRSVYHIGS